MIETRASVRYRLECDDLASPAFVTAADARGKRGSIGVLPLDAAACVAVP
jgi:hypothetical protein